MFVLMRAVTYGTLFVGFLLVFLPGRVLEWSGVRRPASLGLPQGVGLAVVVLGAAIALWCILTFAFIGKGTPAPFDPPRRLVTQGPYRFVRNPMYIGATFALPGVALFYELVSILIYAAVFFLATHLFVVFYEEPTYGELSGPITNAIAVECGDCGSGAGHAAEG